ncbi:GNAT family N-acetyltransferase [Streptomyces sp. HUAS TT3]|uniref:GNAT family N-acetyltransferase n=1 Tax=Streptomyces sp. HUAS TT3 TaxID=3447510 RepID=UPI003F65B7E4
MSARPGPAVDPAAVPDFWKTAAEGTSTSDDLAGIGRLHARDPHALFLARRGGEPVGTVVAGFDGWRCHLRLAVHPDHRRRGIASALLAAAEERFAALGGRRADAMVLGRNERAHAAWDAAGYPQDPCTRWVEPLAGGER